MTSKITGVAAAALLALASHVSQAQDREDVFGLWQTENGASRIHITLCEADGGASGAAGGEVLCGHIVWTHDNATRRLGTRILDGFTYEDGAWDGGEITDPRDGSTYRSSLEMTSADALKVRGCLFIFCGGQTWTRLPTQSVEAAPHVEFHSGRDSSGGGQ